MNKIVLNTWTSVLRDLRAAVLPCQGKTRVCTAPSLSSFPYSLCLIFLQKVNSDFLAGQDCGNFPAEPSNLLGLLTTQMFF